MGDTGKKYIPEGAFLTCNKGAGMQQLKIPTRISPTLYGELWANMMDATPMVNILPLGACSILKGPCMPATAVWSQPADNPSLVAGLTPITETSTCQCMVGGQIAIHFTRAAASNSINEQEAKKEAAAAKTKSAWLFVAAIAVGVVAVAAVVVTGGAALAVIGPALATAAAAGAVGGAVAGAVHGGVDAYQESGGKLGSTIVGSLKGAATGAAIGAGAGVLICAGGPVAGALALGAGGYMAKGMVHDVQAYYYNPSSENGFVLVGDVGDILGIIAGARTAKALSKSEAWSAKVREELCKWGFEPVDLISGRVTYEYTDFELPGPIPIRWKRVWDSDSGLMGSLGFATHLCYNRYARLIKEDEALVILLADGRPAVCPLLMPGGSYYHPQENFTVSRKHNGHFLLEAHKENLYYHFNHEVSTDLYMLSLIEDYSGFRVQLHYSGKYLSGITDSASRQLIFNLNQKGCITEVELAHKGQRETLMSYGYNPEGDLVRITDALGQHTVISFTDHLMTSKTDRNGQTFYWEYDNRKRCVHTAGTDGTLEGWIEYYKGFNIVTNSLKETTTYYYNEDNLCVQETDAYSHSKFTEYTESGQLYREIDEEGITKSYTYDRYDRLKETVNADGTRTSYNYNDQHQLVMVAYPDDSVQTYFYDEKKRIKGVTYPNGNFSSYEYNNNGLLYQVTAKGGKQTLLEYDNDANLTKVFFTDSSFTAWKYDSKGRCLESINTEGQRRQFAYDELNRVKSIYLPDGNTVQLKYNAYEEVTEASDKLGSVQFEYTALGLVKKRKQNNTELKFSYDTEQRLNYITNEAGKVYRFGYNKRGEITREVGFDDLERNYERDKAGKIIKTKRPGGRSNEYEYDANGRIVRTAYHDGTWEIFNYDKSGNLKEAGNAFSSIRLKRNSIGLVEEEIQDGCTSYSVQSKYDLFGNRTSIQSSLGANIVQERDNAGNVTRLQAKMDEMAWEAQMKYNRAGQEIEKLLPGNIISQWQYDYAGRPSEHMVKKGAQYLRSKEYHWKADDRLTSIFDALNQNSTKFRHDDFGNLIWAQYADNSIIHRSSDATGNLYETAEKSDRKYGAGGKLLETKRHLYKYDEEGNLISKTDKQTSNKWHYEWYANGMLRQVVKPDGKEVTFKYDALGRRIEKCYNQTVTRWVWDGNVPLHEWQYPETQRPQPIVDESGKVTYNKPELTNQLTTWIFDTDSFRPAAKIINGLTLSIICDYLGTPQEMYDEQGIKVWEGVLDIYGRMVTLEGNKGDCPFRYQGQYEDVETELYYNRFRYYSSEEGIYISQDLIRLEGGKELYGYVRDTNTYIDPWGLVEVKNFPNFDSARNEAFKRAGFNDPSVVVTPTKYDPITGTEVEFKGTNGGKVAYDTPHADMDPVLGHDKPHVGVQEPGKVKNGGGKKYNFTYEGEQHPGRSADKSKGNLKNCP